jgi:hypothetical protein
MWRSRWAVQLGRDSTGGPVNNACRLSVDRRTVRFMTEARKPPVAQTLTLMFDNEPTWGDLLWFAQQAKDAGIDLKEKVVFEWDEDHQIGPTGISFFTHPDPTGTQA